MIWMGITLGMSVAISFLLPFPYSLVVIVGVFLGINYFMRKRQLRMMGIGGGMAKSIAPNIQPGSQEINETMTVVFEVK